MLVCGRPNDRGASGGGASMTEADIDPVVMDWIYAHEMLRRLNFTADELFFACGEPAGIIEDGEVHDLPDGTLVQMVLKAQGLEFRWTIGSTLLSVEDTEKVYLSAAQWWRCLPADYPDDGLRASRPFQQSVGLLLALKRKGFSIRAE